MTELLNMKKLYILLLVSVIQSLPGIINSALAGDDPCTATSLTVGTSFSAVTGSNSGATNSTIPDATCDGGNSDGDVWYSALAGANGTLIIETRPGTLTDIGMALYTGSSCSNITFLSCHAGGTPGFSNMPYKSLSGLTPGSQIWIRLWDVGNDDVGTFLISAYVNCSASVSITGPSSGCSATPSQFCATAGFTTYSWTGGYATTCINVNATATYTVTVTDADGCTATKSKSYTLNASPTISITGPSSACSSESPQLCAPNGFSNYSWSTGASSKCISPTSTGAYTATVTNSKGCTASDTKLISIYTSPTISVTGPSSKCSGATVQLCVSTGYNNYSWSNSGTTACINPLTTATYTATVTDVNGCTATASKAFTVNALPSVTITGASTGCTATGIQLCAGTFTSYSWSTGATTSCITPTTTGSYSVTVTNSAGCTGSSSKSITINQSPTVAITGPTSGCAGAGVQLCTGTNSSYSWSTGATTSCITPTSTGTFTVTATNASGCTGSASKAFTINANPSVSITGPSSGCAGAGLQLCTGTNSSYSWSTGATTMCITPAATGSYTVTATNASGCTGSASKTFTISAPLTVSLTGPSNACPGSNPQICVSGNYSSYSWSNGGTSSCISPSNSGSYTVTVTNSSGCTGTASKSITYYPAASVAVTGPTSACSGTSAQLCATSGLTSYSWSTGSSSTCISPTTSGTYTVTATNSNGCTGTASRTFTSLSRPSSSITGPVSICNGGSVQLCAPAGNSNYLWSDNSTNSCLTASSNGTYSVTVTGSNGCTSSSSHSLIIDPAFSMAVTGPTTACYGSNPQLCATSGSFTYQWSNGATTNCISPSTSGIYSVIATNPAGCTNNASLGLTVYSQLSATVSGQSSACIGSVIQLCATSGSTSYAWSTGATTSCINVNNSGVYSVTIADGNGCTTSASKTVTFSNSISVQITGPVSGCIGSSSTLCVPTGYSSYAWNTGETSECINVSSSGNYSVTVHDQIGCVANDFYTLPFNTPPTVNITGSSIICSGTATNWCATPGLSSYQWSNGGTSDCINISNEATYTITITDANGCAASASSDLQVVNIMPAIFESGGLLVCDTFNTDFTYNWLINGQPTGCTSQSCSPSFSGIYSVEVTHTTSGCTESATYNYINDGIPSVNSQFSINIYPNPFSGNKFTIDFNDLSSEKINMKIVDAIGKLIYDKSLTIPDNAYTLPVNLPSYVSGIYYVTITSKKGVIGKRIVAN